MGVEAQPVQLRSSPSELNRPQKGYFATSPTPGGLALELRGSKGKTGLQETGRERMRRGVEGEKEREDAE